MTRALLAACLLAPVLLPAQDAGPVFRADVNLVRVDVDVAGRGDGRPLTAADFVVLDNGRPQQVTHSTRDELPLDLILLFDISGSMKPGVKRVAAGARAALAQLRPGDRAAVFAFEGRLRPLLALTADLEKVRQTIEEDLLSLEFSGTTALQASIHAAAAHFPEQEPGARRRAMLVITDNRGNNPGVHLPEVINRLWRLDVVVSGLILRMPGEVRRVKQIGVTARARRSLKEARDAAGMDPVVEATGGEMVRTGDPEDDFKDTLKRLRQRYTLYYPMPEGPPGEQRTIKVELTPEGRRHAGRPKLLARTGYQTPPAR